MVTAGAWSLDRPIELAETRPGWVPAVWVLPHGKASTDDHVHAR
jgi:hypothetical protein